MTVLHTKLLSITFIIIAFVFTSSSVLTVNQIKKPSKVFLSAESTQSHIFEDELWMNIDFKKFSRAYNQNVSVKEFGSHLLISELF